MRLLLWHCTHLSYTDMRHSTRPGDVADVVEPPQSVSWEDVLATFVCVESGDAVEQIEGAASAIAEALDRLGRRQVVVVPFAHLSSRLASPAAAVGALQDLVSRCRTRDIPVALASFGYHKRFRLSFEAKGHPGSVGYRELPPRQVNHS
jgi:threonyl-tRNA synthetase